MNEIQRKLLQASPAVWFISEIFRGHDYISERERILSAARFFRKLDVHAQHDAEAAGRLLGTALGILKSHQLPRLDQSWEPSWLQPPHDETNQELDWNEVSGMVNQSSEVD